MIVPRSTPARLIGIRPRAVPHGGKKPFKRPTVSAISRLASLPIAASLVFLVTYRTSAAADNQGAQLAATCASCHRLDGRDKGIPPVVGRDEESLARALLAYKSGVRQSPIMHAVAGSLSDEEIAIVARYLAARGKEAKQP